MDVEKESGVLLGLSAQRVVAVHNNQLFAQLVNTYRPKNTEELQFERFRWSFALPKETHNTVIDPVRGLTH